MERGDDTLPYQIGCSVVLERLQDDDKLVTAQSKSSVRFPGEPRQSVGSNLDDFVTGGMAERVVDIIKIDRSFLQSINDSYQSLGLISDIVQLAQRLGLSVIAEGIEEESIKNRLADIGVTYGQGFLFTPALTAEDLLEWASVQSTATA